MQTAPIDAQVPVVREDRPALVVVWLGNRRGAAAPAPAGDETLTPSPPVELYLEQVSGVLRRVRARLVD